MTTDLVIREYRSSDHAEVAALNAYGLAAAGVPADADVQTLLTRPRREHPGDVIGEVTQAPGRIDRGRRGAPTLAR